MTLSSNRHPAPVPRTRSSHATCCKPDERSDIRGISWLAPDIAALIPGCALLTGRPSSRSEIPAPERELSNPNRSALCRLLFRLSADFELMPNFNDLE